MEIDWWQLIFVIAVAAHGIGHVLGFIHVSELVNLQGMPDNASWLLTGKLGLDKAIMKPVSVLFLVTTVGFLAVAGAFWFDVSWWKTLAAPMIVLSVALFVTWFTSFDVNVPIGAAIGNIVVIAGLLQFN